MRKNISFLSLFHSFVVCLFLIFYPKWRGNAILIVWWSSSINDLFYEKSVKLDLNAQKTKRLCKQGLWTRSFTFVTCHSYDWQFDLTKRCYLNAWVSYNIGHIKNEWANVKIRDGWEPLSLDWHLNALKSWTWNQETRKVRGYWRRQTLPCCSDTIQMKSPFFI